MKNLMMIWLGLAMAVAFAIAVDMSRLHANSVGLSLTEWALLCACAGALAVVPYLILRQNVRQRLVDAAWALIGDESHAPELRHQRLFALKRSGLMGVVVFRACLRSLDADHTA